MLPRAASATHREAPGPKIRSPLGSPLVVLQPCQRLHRTIRNPKRLGIQITLKVGNPKFPEASRITGQWPQKCLKGSIQALPATCTVSSLWQLHSFQPSMHLAAGEELHKSSRWTKVSKKWYRYVWSHTVSSRK